MRAAFAALALILPGMASAASLDTERCAEELTVETHRTACSRYTDDTGKIAFDVAVFSPTGGKSKGHVIYIPGGPGEIPTRDGPPADLFAYLREHTLIAFAPRGVEGSTPHIHCDLGDGIWNEEYSAEEGLTALRACRDRLSAKGIDPGTVTSAAIAKDIDALVRVLGVDRAGVYGISYGTEPALHLLADPPGWLDFAILDSVSVPGISGIIEERAARERFLATLDRQCFAQKTCGPLTRMGNTDLTEWAAQFDAEPLEFSLSKGDVWSFDSTDMLDFLGTLGTYVEGLQMATDLVDLLATSRLQALGWIRADLEGAVAFSDEALPLMLEAYSDTFSPQDFDTVAAQGRYATDIDDWRVQLQFQQFWRGDRPGEAAFIPETAAPTPTVRTLILSGGIDPATPQEWAARLDHRFTGLTRYVFPVLGHAVSLGNPGWVEDETVSDQMLCANAAVRAFLDPTMRVNAHCRRYKTGNNG